MDSITSFFAILDIPAQLPSQPSSSPAQIPVFVPAPTSAPLPEVSQSVSPVERPQPSATEPESSESSTEKKFQFNPDAPSFVPTARPLISVTPQPQQPYIAAPSLQPTYIQQPVTSTVPGGYILTTQVIPLSFHFHLLY